MSHLRRQDRAITDPAEVDRILSAGRFVTLAMVDGDEPYAVTLSYGYDCERHRLCCHVAPIGRKLDIVAANSRVCATVVEDLGYLAGECAHPFASVVLTGMARVLEDPDDVRLAMRTLIGQLESAEDAAAVWERNHLDADAVYTRFRVLVIDIGTVSAKRGQ
ncbi:MAG: hypothetical protein HGA39_07330 [Coriobacteriia bacterium]|nr:hypothetical protein [Coriobacteriia bacterium]